jgi:hypothetical protein
MASFISFACLRYDGDDRASTAMKSAFKALDVSAYAMPPGDTSGGSWAGRWARGIRRREREREREVLLTIKK